MKPYFDGNGCCNKVLSQTTFLIPDIKINQTYKDKPFIRMSPFEIPVTVFFWFFGFFYINNAMRPWSKDP